MSVAQPSLPHGNRMDYLARPKTDFLRHQNRPSVYWPMKPQLMTVCGLSKRQEELAHPKSVHNNYKQDRPSPIWPIKASSLTAVPSPRIKQLAQAKGVSVEWQEDRSVYSIVSEGAKRASATHRIIQLSMPRQSSTEAPPRTPNIHQLKREGSATSEKRMAPTARTEALAVPKTEHHQFQHDLPIERKVPASALHAQASDRICQLAKPRIRKAIFEGYDPYKISPAAKNADASPRVLELSTPPSRRHQPKKI
ncbi:testicular haploid expressed gene protein [Spea bombifrons]|uniref:testicular haploid expressed gene protein n=1 Tax=Spea bombifrons TaxID=233779 RepID=UPI002349162D|nr:testicular haploid expressed gene protein [Spea bombifrons]